MGFGWGRESETTPGKKKKKKTLKRRKMGETRPVPRRESPWGTPEGEHRQPKAHRCNDRAEDVIQVPYFYFSSSFI